MWSIPPPRRNLWCASSWSESFRLLVWQAETTNSEQGLFRERTPVCSGFSELLFLEVPGTTTEEVQDFGFRRNLSSLDKAHKMRNFVRLVSWGSFLVTLPSTSSEIWVMYFSAIPGLSVFCGWLFYLFSGVSLETAPNFLLSLNVAMILREKLFQFWRLNWFFSWTNYQSPVLWGERFNKCKQLTMENSGSIPKKLQVFQYSQYFRFSYLYRFPGGRHSCLHTI